LFLLFPVKRESASHPPLPCDGSAPRASRPPPVPRAASRRPPSVPLVPSPRDPSPSLWSRRRAIRHPPSGPVATRPISHCPAPPPSSLLLLSPPRAAASSRHPADDDAPDGMSSHLLTVPGPVPMDLLPPPLKTPPSPSPSRSAGSRRLFFALRPGSARSPAVA
jgi:hypothetical protein